MRSRWGARRALVALAIAAGLVLVTGCSTRGDVTFGTDAMIVDLRVRHPQGQDGVCDPTESVTGLIVQDRTFVEGEVTCTVTGTVPLEDESGEGTGLSAIMSFSGGHQFLVLPRGVMWAGNDVDVTLHFAGPVIAATPGAEVDGSSVRLRDVAKIDGEGLGVTARTVALPPQGLVPAGLGLALGAVLLSAAVIAPGALRKRTAHTTSDSDGGPVPASLPTGDHPTSASQARAILPPEDPAVWAPDHPATDPGLTPPPGRSGPVGWAGRFGE